MSRHSCADMGYGGSVTKTEPEESSARENSRSRGWAQLPAFPPAPREGPPEKVCSAQLWALRLSLCRFFVVLFPTRKNPKFPSLPQQLVLIISNSITPSARIRPRVGLVNPELWSKLTVFVSECCEMRDWGCEKFRVLGREGHRVQGGDAAPRGSTKHPPQHLSPEQGEVPAPRTPPD